MNEKQVMEQAFSMPLSSASYPPGPYRFINREYLIITYRTDPAALARVLPAPLEAPEPLVKYEFIRMPDSSGFGNYTESGQVIPVQFQGRSGSYVHSMYLDDFPAIAAGREIWGFPKKFGKPSLCVDTDTLLGTLHYGSTSVATGTMGYKYAALSPTKAEEVLSEPNFLLKIIPDVNGSPALLQLVEYQLSDVLLKGAWTGPGALELKHHALAPVADLPVLEVISATHLIADLTLPYGRIVHDYLDPKKP